MAYQKEEQTKVIRNGQNIQVTAPSDMQRNPRLLSFIDMVNYLPAKDDDFSFIIIPEGENKFKVSTTRGNPKSYLKFRVTHWDIPAYIKWVRKIITLKGQTDSAAVEFAIPEGQKGLVIIELLTYDTGGDDDVDDVAYAVRATAIERNIIVSAINDFGRKGASKIVLRATMLNWPSEKNVQCQVERGIAVMKNPKSFKPKGSHWIATPTAYMTDTSKYTYSKFDNLLVSINSPSVAGKKIDYSGIVKDITKVGTAIATKDALLIAKEVAKAAYKYIKLGLGPDERDDDFYFTTQYNASNNNITVAIGDGNKYSLSEITVFSLNFP